MTYVYLLAVSESLELADASAKEASEILSHQSINVIIVNILISKMYQIIMF